MEDVIPLESNKDVDRSTGSSAALGSIAAHATTGKRTRSKSKDKRQRETNGKHRKQPKQSQKGKKRERNASVAKKETNNDACQLQHTNHRRDDARKEDSDIPEEAKLLSEEKYRRTMSQKKLKVSLVAEDERDVLNRND